MSLFDPRCPMCGSRYWRSWLKDKDGINELIQCLRCGVIRGRKQQPTESIQ